MQYLHIQYPDPDQTILVKAYRDAETLDNARGFFEFLQCLTAQTNKATYEKRKDALKGKCEACCVNCSAFIATDTGILLCESCCKIFVKPRWVLARKATRSGIKSA